MLRSTGDDIRDADPHVCQAPYCTEQSCYVLADAAQEALAGDSVDDVSVWTDSKGRTHIDIQFVEKSRSYGEREQLVFLADAMVKAAGRLLLELDD